MRITSGTAKGRILSVPKGHDIRPTTDKVRQALYNMLLSYSLPKNSIILDIFCGTGALGLEGLSRGASHAIFIDRDLGTAKSNAAALNFTGNSYFIRKTAPEIGIKPQTLPGADLVFADPPYHKNLLAPTLRALYDGGWLAPDALIIAETEKNFPWHDITGFTRKNSRFYGDCHIHIIETIQNLGQS